MPVLYHEVRELAQKLLGNTGYNMRPRTVKELTKEYAKSLWCKYCNYKSKVEKDVKSHMKRNHSIYDDQRNFDDINEVLAEEAAEAEELVTLDEAVMETNVDNVTIEDVQNKEDHVVIQDLPQPPQQQQQSARDERGNKEFGIGARRFKANLAVQVILPFNISRMN